MVPVCSSRYYCVVPVISWITKSLLSIRQLAIFTCISLVSHVSNTDFLFIYIQQLMTLRSLSDECNYLAICDMYAMRLLLTCELLFYRLRLSDITRFGIMRICLRFCFFRNSARAYVLLDYELTVFDSIER